ncbi:MAG: mechanosensitive ion channel [Leptospiraceae bacterium]|nr:mechanosensitive ion channel [Leptospiraceae bacterium]
MIPASAIQIPVMNFIEFFVLGIGLFVFLNFLGIFLSRFSLKRAIGKKIYRIYPTLQVFLFVYYAIWVFANIFTIEPMYYYISSLLIVLLSVAIHWNFLRDISAGVVLKAEDRLKVGNSIQIGERFGRVLEIGYRGIILEDEKGDKIRLPYSYMAGEIISNRNGKKLITSHSFSIDGNRNNIPELRKKIEKIALYHRWTPPSQPPTLIADGTTAGQILVTVYTLGEFNGLQVEEKIRRELDKELS